MADEYNMISELSEFDNLSAVIGFEAFSSGKKRKRMKMKKNKRKRMNQFVIDDLDDLTVNMVDKAKQVNIGQHPEMVSMETVETESHVTKNSSVLQKRLRRARYFDPPQESSCVCRNCGEEGHRENNCRAQKRKRPCFVCGTFEHSWRRCKLRRNCFLCKERGHVARHCPNGNQVDNPSPIICLRCGDSGHDMFSCPNDYCPSDIKEIQCYVCKSLGHLCCVDSRSGILISDSCYNCGQSGHLGSLGKEMDDRVGLNLEVFSA
ncbi:uncharacterized protein LOC133790582 isoform X2 [Humulus lupulus]|uniref:uncharacterized protein LOC133790582 isoform X2 n=1 Tax=Humulus lupulus TaxID=3486 RepID=UPI002B4070E4|nr:uncharacterized protein LOC133790582 isoform X2 [Humulus lupulus]